MKNPNTNKQLQALAEFWIGGWAKKETRAAVMAHPQMIKALQILKGLCVALGGWTVLKIVRFLKWRREMLKRFQGPEPSLLLGNVMDLVKSGGFGESFFEELHKDGKKIARFFIGPAGLNLSVVDAELQQEVYKLCQSRPLETQMFLGYLGHDNLLFTHGEMVKKLRLRYGKMVISEQQIQKLHQVSHERTYNAIQHWGDQNQIDVFAELGPLLYDIMGSVLFNIPWSESEEGPKIYKMHKYLIEWTNTWMFWPIGPIWLPKYREYLQTIKDWRALCAQLLDKRRKDIAENPDKYAKDVSALTMLVTETDQDGKPFFTKHRAVSTLCGFLNGAYDTTHATQFWLLFHLARNQGSQHKLIKELDDKIGNGIPTVDQLRSCEFLDAFICESMRIRCTVPVNQRVNLSQDVTIGGVQVPAGTNINLPMFLTFRDEKYFGPDADRFQPERFLPSSPHSVSARRAFMAFGAHTRTCVGMVSAKVELKCILATILQRYTVHLVNPAEKGTYMIEAGVNQPSPRFPLRFRKRKV